MPEPSDRARRHLLRATAAVAALALLAALLARTPAGRGWLARQRVPRVVVVTFDTLHVDYTSPYNPSVDFTPALARFAGEGVVFDRAYTTVPITLPSHSSLFTGRDPVDLGVMLNGHRLPDDAETLAELLRTAGYRTAAFVSLGVLDRAFHLDQGFEHYEDRLFKRVERWYLTADEVVAAASAWVRESAREPFLLWVHLSDPHEPYVPHDAPPDAELSLDGEVLGSWNLTRKQRHMVRFELPPGRHLLRWRSLRTPRPDDAWDTSLRIRFDKTEGIAPWIADPALDLGAELDLRRPLEIALDNPGERPEALFHFFSGRLAQPPRSEVYENYPGEVAFADRYFGELMSLFDNLDLADDTLWLVASDHGEGLFNHLILGHSDFAQEDQLKIVWMMKGPGVPAGRRIGEAEALIEDFLPTTLELLDLPLPAAVDGRSRVACWGGGCAPREAWWGFGADAGSGTLTALAGYRWPFKVLWQIDPGSGCYDLATDRWERDNLCKGYTRDPDTMPAEVAWLDRGLAHRRSELQGRLEALGRGELDAERLEMLRSLGYIGR